MEVTHAPELEPAAEEEEYLVLVDVDAEVTDTAIHVMAGEEGRLNWGCLYWMQTRHGTRRRER